MGNNIQLGTCGEREREGGWTEVQVTHSFHDSQLLATGPLFIVVALRGGIILIIFRIIDKCHPSHS